MDDRPVISTVTPTRNRRDAVLRLAEALKGQTLPPARFEVVVVADGCQDDTVPALRGMDLPYSLTVIEQSQRGAAAARNAGGQAATGFLLVFLDDDMQPVPGLLEAYLRAHEQHPGELILGQTLPVLESESEFFQIGLRNWWQDHATALAQAGHRFDYRDLHSGNFALAAELFERANGFSADLPCREDYELGARLLRQGVRFVHAADALAYHHERSDLQRSLRRIRLEGRADVRIGRLHPDLRAGMSLTSHYPSRSRLERWLRAAAFRDTRRGDRIAGILAGALAPLEWARMRGAWWRLYNAVRAYWYWRGAAEELGTTEELERYVHDPVPPRVRNQTVVDLADGIPAARSGLSAAAPGGAVLRCAGTTVAALPDRPGSEPVRGEHLDAELVARSRDLVAAIAILGLDDREAWTRVLHGAGGRPRSRGVPLDAAPALTYPARCELTRPLPRFSPPSEIPWLPTYVTACGRPLGLICLPLGEAGSRRLCLSPLHPACTVARNDDGPARDGAVLGLRRVGDGAEWCWASHESADAITEAEAHAALARRFRWQLPAVTLLEEEDASPRRPAITVVVCTRGRAQLLDRCLESLAALEYPDREIVVVDNAPTDDSTRRVAGRHPVRYVVEHRPGLDWARNRGIAEARHDIIAFTDDDVRVDPDWLDGVAAGFTDPRVMAVTGLVAPLELETEAQILFEAVYGGMGKGVTGRLHHRSLLDGQDLIRTHNVGVGANMAFRRQILTRLGGFDTALDVGTPARGGGDLDMFHRVLVSGAALWYEPRALVWHQHRRTLDALEQQLYEDGRSFAVYLMKLWRTRSVPRAATLRFAVGTWMRWHAKRVVLGMLGRHRLPLALLWAGLKGALHGPAAYVSTQRADRRMRSTGGSAPALANRAPEASGVAASGRAAPGPELPAVSVIIPAHNAAGTIARCLDSLQAQTHPRFEAVVVDDGSSDETFDIARGYAARDARFVVVQQPRGGVSRSRTAGLGVASHSWVLFLDSDDWILPQHLERMTSTLVANPSLDAVHCGWAIVSPAGEVLEEDRARATGDLFSLLARHPVFVIHACVIRKALVQAVGGFDPDFQRIQDWVTWQRVARMGCRFGSVPETLAMYRMQAGSLSSSAQGVLEESQRAITLGHRSDPHVPAPAPEHAAGRPEAELPEAQLAFVGWPAGMMLARGEDARPLLQHVEPTRWPDLAAHVGEIIVSALPRSLGRPRSCWAELWPEVGPLVEAFLVALEDHARAPGLALSVRRDLARRILACATGPFPRTIATTHGVRLEITEPLDDVVPPPGAERLQCLVDLAQRRLGTIELPVCASVVPAAVLRDAIAHAFAWPILGRFFEHSRYQKYQFRHGPGGWTARHGAREVATGLPDDPAARMRSLHDAAGWDAFVEEVWEPRVARGRSRKDDARDRVVIEVSDPLPRRDMIEPGAIVELRVGGASVGAFRILPADLESPEALRRALTYATGFELCRAAVREALIGAPLDGPDLRTRLRARAAGVPVGNAPPGAAGSLHPDWQRFLFGETATGAAILGRHPHLPVGSSGSRRALLPAGALSALKEVAAADDQPMAFTGQEGQATVVAYVPEIVGGPTVPAGGALASSRAEGDPRRHFDRHHFESIFVRAADPWRYTSGYETRKYEETLLMMPPGPIERALEVGCAEGHFTRRLAPRVRELIAADIAELALRRAAERCAEHHNVEFLRLDLAHDPLPSGNDLIVCSEVLYYAGGRPALEKVAERLAEALKPGGHLLTAHANLVVDEPERTGFEWDVPFGGATIAQVLDGVSRLRLVRELKTPLYRIQLHRRPVSPGEAETPPAREETDAFVLPSPEIAARIRWAGQGRMVRTAPAASRTERLPILMYHRVAPLEGGPRMRWWITPEQFESQLQYLQDTGFRSVTLDEWRAALVRRQPLPGRAVLITFDDGYADFPTFAWPLLRRCGYSATMFIVSGRVGAQNDWDAPAFAGGPLLDWDALRRLRDEGLQFGAHGFTHRRLTTLTSDEVVREATSARAVLQRELDRPISAFAYPFGAEDGTIRHLVGACGYEYGLTCRPALSGLNDDPLDLPRLEVTGESDLRAFIGTLGV